MTARETRNLAEVVYTDPRVICPDLAVQIGSKCSWGTT